MAVVREDFLEEITPDFKDSQELSMRAGVGELGETAGAMNDPEAGKSTLGLPSQPHPDLPFLTSPTQAHPLLAAPQNTKTGR